MEQLTDEIKEQLNARQATFQPLIDCYAKSEPEIMFNFFDGWYKSLFWKSEQATVEFCFYRGSESLQAYKSDELSSIEIDTGYLHANACVERNWVRESFHAEQIEERFIKEAFEWL